MSFSQLLANRANIYSSNVSANAIGEEEVNLIEVANNVPCRINIDSEKAQIFGDETSTRQEGVIYIEVRDDFDEFDYITVNNIEYKVESAPVIYNYGSQHHMELQVYKNRRI